MPAMRGFQGYLYFFPKHFDSALKIFLGLCLLFVARNVQSVNEAHKTQWKTLGRENRGVILKKSLTIEMKLCNTPTSTEHRTKEI